MSIKKSICFLIVLTVITCAQAFTAGNGTPENPYQISTQADLEAVNNDLAASYILINDIDLTGITYTQAVIAYDIDSDASFDGMQFNGYFDGNGFTISNLIVDSGISNFAGLIGCIGEEGRVVNMVLKDCDITGGRYIAPLVKGGAYIGCLVSINHGVISNIDANGMVDGKGSYIGGLVGENSGVISNSCFIGMVGYYGQYSMGVGGLVAANNGTISNSYSAGKVAGVGAVGGLVSMNRGEGIISDCYSRSMVAAYYYDASGLVARNSGRIFNSYSTGRIDPDTYFFGGLVVSNQGSVVNSFWDTQTSWQNLSRGGEGKSTALMQVLSTFIDAGWDFVGESANGTDNIWIMPNDSYPILRWQMFAGGNGTLENPYQISTSEGIEAVNNDLSANYILMNDIDLSTATYTQAVIAPDTSTNYGFQGDEFTGTFNGNGFEIQNITINGGSNDYIALFGSIGSGGSIRSLGIVDCVISGNNYIGGLCGYNDYGTITSSYAAGEVSGEESIGGLCGSNDGTITSSYATGTTSGSDFVGGLCGWIYHGTITSSYATGTASGDAHVGGLCGYNKSGTITLSHAIGAISGNGNIGGLCGNNKSTISSSYATGTVSGNYHIGGLCGDNDGTITLSYSTGTVSGGDYVGGLCGGNSNTITLSYTTGTVSGDDYIGRLCGYNYYGTITLSYATGAISGDDYVGGLCGYNNHGTITSSYTTGEVSGDDYVGGLCGRNDSGTITSSFWDTQTSGQTTSAGGVGKTTIQMKTQATFIDAGWYFAGEETNGIHEVWYMGASGYPELYVFSESYQKHTFEGLGNSQSPYHIYDKYDLTAVNQNIVADYILMNDINLSNTVFDSVPVIFSFNGGFDGNGFAIKNLGISGNSDHIGLFGQIGSAGVIANLGIINCDISGRSYVGGLCGYNHGTITSSYVTGEVLGNYYVGGLCGCNHSGTITSSYATSVVSSNNSVAGGLCGLNYRGTIISSYATGEVSGYNDTGGLCGYNSYPGTITSSFWDIETSGQAESAGGQGKTTAQMKIINTFLDAGWDFSGYSADWFMPEDSYPVFGGFAGQPMRMDIVSMAMLANCWLQTDLVLDDPNNLCYQIDLNGDSTINDDDLLAITNNWLGYHFWENMVNFDDSDFNDDDSWTYGGMDEWLIVDGEGTNGSVCFKSDDVSYGQDADLDWVVDTTGFNTIGFNFKFDAWSNCVLTFYINGVEAYSHSGAVDWTYVELPIPAAEHTLTWTFTRGFAFSYGENAAYLDNVILFNK